VSWRIPFNRASLTGNELDYLEQAVANGHVSGDGPFTQACERVLEQETGAARALLTPSCTHALEMAALLLDLAPGDEVVVPSFTFVSTASAFALRGAKLVFADVRPDTLNLDEQRLPGVLTDRTRAVVAVHYAGVGCELDAIGDVLEPRGIELIEDAAHALFASYRGRPLGSFGTFAALSFHETKNLTSGEGGALLLNDEAYVERAEVVREKGTNRKQFFRGAVDKYTWVDVGSSYLMSDLGAAFLAAQLEHRDAVQKARRRIWERYAHELEGWAERLGARLPIVPPHTNQSWHMFYVLMPSLDARTAVIDHLRQRGILAVFHYLPLHLSPMGRRYGGAEGQCPVTEDVADRLVRLPFFTGMTDDEQSTVLGALHDFRL
jgi:dTDP-4-amino-4,6-dideoxygalactose transaminase